MLKKLSGKIILKLCEDKIIDKDEQEIYEYGLYHFMSTGLWLGMALIISLLFQELLLGVIFILAFKALRKYAGGYHAKTPAGCFILSTVIYIGVLLEMKYIVIDEKLSWGILIMAAMTVFLLSPVAAINKPLDMIEKKIYRRKVWCAVLIELLIALGSGWFHYQEIVNCIIMAQGIVGLALIAGNISIHKEKTQQFHIVKS